MYAYWVCAARETPIFIPIFPFRSISFSHITKKNPFPSITILHHLAEFAVPETIIFKISLVSTRSSPPTVGSARTRVSGRLERQPDASWQFRRIAFSRSKRIKLVPEPRIFKLKTAQARSGAPHFHARLGARSGARAHFSLCRGTYLPKFGVSTPPPPDEGLAPS